MLQISLEFNLPKKKILEKHLRRKRVTRKYYHSDYYDIYIKIFDFNDLYGLLNEQNYLSIGLKSGIHKEKHWKSSKSNLEDKYEVIESSLKPETSNILKIKLQSNANAFNGLTKIFSLSELMRISR